MVILPYLRQLFHWTWKSLEKLIFKRLTITPSSCLRSNLLVVVVANLIHLSTRTLALSMPREPSIGTMTGAIPRLIDGIKPKHVNNLILEYIQQELSNSNRGWVSLLSAQTSLKETKFIYLEIQVS